MISTRTIKIIIAGALLAHGIAHVNAVSALISQTLAGPSTAVVTVQSWLLPSLSPNIAALVALPFWVISTLGFLAATVSFWGLYLPDLGWRRVAVVAAMTSTLGIAFTGAIWPGTPEDLRLLIHPLAAMAMNLAIFVTQFWLRWPPKPMFSK